MYDRPIRMIAFGAHPDDCEIFCGGLATRYAKLGHAVKFVSVTNGNAGHHKYGGKKLSNRRVKEAEKAASIGGFHYEILNNDDGQLVPSLDIRMDITRLIREWNADLVLTHRPNDYHPDHRYTSMMVQDAAYMVMVPNIAKKTPALTYNPYFFYFWDPFQKPYPFQSDIAINIDREMEKKWEILHCHTSQFYEWLPYVEGTIDHVPTKKSELKDWLIETWSPFLAQMTLCCHEQLILRYGADLSQSIQFAETFEICEYGKKPTLDALERLFPK